MKTLRYYFSSDSLDDLEATEARLKELGLSSFSFHVLSNDLVGVEERGLNSVHSLAKRDILRSGLAGAGIGLLGAGLVLAFGWFAGLTGTAAGWVPFVFLAIVVFGFCTWEGGLFGIQEPNRVFKDLQPGLKQGKHYIFLDVAPDQINLLLTLVDTHSELKFEALDRGKPGWMMRFAEWFRQGVDRNLASRDQFERQS